LEHDFIDISQQVEGSREEYVKVPWLNAQRSDWNHRPFDSGLNNGCVVPFHGVWKGGKVGKEQPMEWKVSREEFKECEELRWDVLWFGKIRCEGEETAPFAVTRIHVNAVERCGTVTSDIAIRKESENERVMDWFVNLVDVSCR